MTTIFTIDGYVLEAMLAFTTNNRGFTGHAILLDVLVEVTPESVRLVATDTHVLGLLHLTPILGYHLDIHCDGPVSLVLPIEQFRPVLKDRKLPVTVTLENEQVTITSMSGLSLTLPGRPATEFPCYERVLALDTPITPTTRTAYDIALLTKFAAFAKTMGQPPHLDLAFHGVLSPASVRIAGLSGFYGIIMPRQLTYEEPIPAWLLPSESPAVENPRIIHLHDLDGVDTFTGTDADGQVWTQFIVDELVDQTPGICAICGAELQRGWTNLDNGGEEVCDSHIVFAESEEEDALGECTQSDVTPFPIAAEMPVAIPA